MARRTQAQYEHPSQDRSGRFAVDELLRRFGWRILSRPKRGQAVWRKGDRRWTHARALRTLDAEALADAYLIEELYYDGFL